MKKAILFFLSCVIAGSLHAQKLPCSNQIIYTSTPFKYSKDSMAIRKMTFTSIHAEKIRQFGEISKDKGISWSTEYDLEYRRKK